MLSFVPAITQAQCNFSITDALFGAVDTLGGAVVDTTATLNVSCTGVPLTTIGICPHIGAGSGGQDSSARYLQGPTTTLAYQLYSDASRTVVWGSAYTGFGSVPTINLPLGLGGSANTTQTIYGRVFGGQSPVPEGTYTSNFTTSDVNIDSGLGVLGINICDTLPSLAEHDHPTFKAKGTVDKNCIVTAEDIGFGNHGVLSADVTADGLVTLQCTPLTDYMLTLNNGKTGTGPTDRKMRMSTYTVTYGLYKDPSHNDPWGDSGGTTVTGTGDGTEEDLPVYGLVPAQPTPRPGLYKDNVVATVVY